MTTTARSTTDSVLTTRDLGPAPEKAVAKDLVRRGLLVLPVALAIGFVGWGVDGVASVAFAYALVLVNHTSMADLLALADRVRAAIRWNDGVRLARRVQAGLTSLRSRIARRLP